MDSSYSPSARPDALRIPPEPPDDGPSWLVTFSDLVLQLFAFLLVGLVVTRAATSPQVELAVARSTTVASSFAAPATERSPTDVATAAMAEREVVALAPRPAPRRAAAAAAPAEAPAAAPPAVPAQGESVSTVEDSPAIEAVAASAAPEVSPAPQVRVASAERLQATGRYLSALVAGIAGENAPQVSVRADEIVVTLADGIGFDSGRSELSTPVRHVLEELRSILRSVPGTAIEVSGHTDDRPIQTTRFPSNLELSLARASEVASFLSAGHADLERRIFASGHGDRRPRASNRDDAGRAQNRRVEIRLLTLGS
jgi:flagellar motor protein MotB